MADTDTSNNGYETNDWVCQQNSATIMRSANIPEEEKSEVKFFFLHNQKFYSFFHCKVLELHLDLATKARSYLKAQFTAAKVTILKLYTEKDLPLPTIGACLLPASNNITMHFSFDMAQQVCKFRLLCSKL